MKEILSPSLLPYLQADGNQIRLEISLSSRDPLFLEKSPFPFLLIDESTPFERLLEAKIVTGAGSELRRVFMLQQADTYRHATDGMWPLTNVDIDQRWKTALDFFSSKKKTDRPKPIWLFEPIQDSVGYLPFKPLFFCSFKNAYFHPPCLECGDLLDLCRNDRLLAEAGLMPYRTSLRRYLYCPRCHQNSENVQFYTYSRQGDDPVNLKDRWDLINHFGNLILKSDASKEIPCSTCPELSACYGGDNRVAFRIVPFSFYPFYMLIFEADTLSAPDFLALVSGAAVEALKANMPKEKTGGRQHCLQLYERQQDARAGMLFGNENENSFLEILYLKLSFLGELIARFYADANQGIYCDASLSLDRIWVRLTDQAGQLPQFWNFTLSVIDLWSNGMHQPHLSKYPPAYGHHFLGNIWFYALLVNQHQSMGTVRAELEKLILASSEPDKGASEIMPIDVGNPVFAPENIYWHPESKQVAENWHSLWIRSLELGKALLAAGMQAEQKWSSDGFWSELITLKSDIKAALFGIAPSAAPTATLSDDLAITGVLSRLLDKWHREIRTRTIISPSDSESMAPSSTDHNTDEDDTLILPKKGQFHQPKPGTESAEEDSLHETVIQASGIRSHPTRTKTDEPEAKPLQETVMLSPEKQSGPPAPGAQSPAEESLQETIILSPKSRPQPPKPEIESPEEELIQETVILSPAKSNSTTFREGVRNTDIGAEHLPETIVLSPGKRSQGKDEEDAQTTDPDCRKAVPHDFEGSDVPLRLDPKQAEHPPQDNDILTETVILRPKDDKGSKDE